MNDKKAHRIVADITDGQNEAWELALNSFQDRQPNPMSGQAVVRQLISDFCRSEGVRFPPTPRDRRGRRRHRHCHAN